MTNVRESAARTIVDMHACPSKNADHDLAADLELYRGAGVDLVILNAGDSRLPLEDIVRTLVAWRRRLAEYPERYALIGSVAEMRAAKRAGRMGVCFDVEGAYALGAQLEIVDLFAGLGVRWMSFVYNRRNLVGYGCHDPHDEGLTPLGERLVQTLDRAGVIKCCSHAGYRTALDVFAASELPSILSHSNPRGLFDHERNAPDELLRACAATGGLIGMNGVGLFVGNSRPNANDLFACIDYAVELVGPEHVGIGLDYMFVGHGADSSVGHLERDPETWPPDRGYSEKMTALGPDGLPAVVELMERHGYPETVLRGILGENFLRVAEQVWRAAN